MLSLLESTLSEVSSRGDSFFGSYPNLSRNDWKIPLPFDSELATAAAPTPVRAPAAAPVDNSAAFLRSSFCSFFPPLAKDLLTIKLRLDSFADAGLGDLWSALPSSEVGLSNCFTLSRIFLLVGVDFVGVVLELLASFELLEFSNLEAKLLMTFALGLVLNSRVSGSECCSDSAVGVGVSAPVCSNED